MCVCVCVCVCVCDLMYCAVLSDQIGYLWAYIVAIQL